MHCLAKGKVGARLINVAFWETQLGLTLSFLWSASSCSPTSLESLQGGKSTPACDECVCPLNWPFSPYGAHVSHSPGTPYPNPAKTFFGSFLGERLILGPVRNHTPLFLYLSCSSEHCLSQVITFQVSNCLLQHEKAGSMVV